MLIWSKLKNIIFSTIRKGINPATSRHIIIYVVSIPSEYDKSNIWPLTGKQYTVGIVEPWFLYKNDDLGRFNLGYAK